MEPHRTRTLVVAEGARARVVAKCLERGDPSAEIQCASPADAHEVVMRERPEIVLAVAAPNLVRTLRACAPEVPIVALVSGDTDEGARALEDGATDVLVDGELEPTLLAWRVHLALERHDAEVTESASANKSEFLSSMSHEIRTPLNTVLGMAELLAETSLDDRQRSYVGTLRRASDHVLSLIEEVLDIARIEAGTITMDDAAFELNETVERAIELVKLQARRRKLDVGFTAGPDLPRFVRGDCRRLRQVLVNLLGNAIKFTHVGRVWITITREPCDDALAALHFVVSDTGIGIAPDKLEAIFSGFVQADTSIERRFGGFGLGLNIAKQIVERMDGRIWAESKLGSGSAFHVAITLPIENARPPSFPDEKPTGRITLRPANGRDLRILVVDDSEDNRILLGEYLRGANVDVDFADDGPSALDKATTHPFDVVLMDLQIPGMDGHDTTRALKRFMAERSESPPPVIALSADVRAESIAASAAAGCTLHLTKPIRKRTLLEAVARVTGARVVDERAPPRVGLREDLRPLLPRFFHNRKNDVRVIREALAHDDLQAIATLAHNMRGTGASYGFPEISKLGDGLESAGRRSDRHEIARLVDELERLVARFESSAN